MTLTDRISTSYDASNATFRLLRSYNWGPMLLNLGWFPFRGPLKLLNLPVDLAKTQAALVRRSAALLKIADGDTVLDIACGRGKSSLMIGQLYPECEVVGVDLLPENIQVAATVFGNSANLKYEVGDAMDLRFADGSYDKVHCLEAAFHFPDRRRFLREAHRVLRDGGRLVVVDFAWNGIEQRRFLDDERTRLVREIWQWDDLFAVDEYKTAAEEAGFAVESCIDWSGAVTSPLQSIFAVVSWLGQRSWGRRLVALSNPMLRGMPDSEWREIDASVEAHGFVRKHSKYIALVLRKPAMGR